MQAHLQIFFQKIQYSTLNVFSLPYDFLKGREREMGGAAKGEGEKES